MQRHIRAAMLVLLLVPAIHAWAQDSPICPIEVAHLLADDGETGDGLGIAVAVSGDTVIVGASGDDDNGASAGAAYVFEYDGIEWVQSAKLLADDGEASDLFGGSVAIEGETLVVGARYDDDNGADAGAAYVFRYDGASWIQETKLLSDDGAADDRFGYVVRIAGGRIFIGTISAHDGKGQETGSVYVFEHDGAIWFQAHKLLADDGEEYDHFGRSLSIDEDTLVVGADGDDDTGGASGAAYVFQFNGSAWVQQAKLLAETGWYNDHFGSSVAVEAGTIVVGAKDDDVIDYNSGSAYVFRFDGTQWLQETKLVPDDPSIYAQFGAAVALASGAVIVGAPGADATAENSGNGYVFRFDGAEWIQRLAFTPSDLPAFTSFGDALAATEATLIVSARPENQYTGAAYVFDLASSEEDCNDNGILDECEPDEDCNNNGTRDICDIGAGTSEDCNGNLVPDECDLTDATSVDQNSNGIPDECEGIPTCASFEAAMELADLDGSNGFAIEGAASFSAAGAGDINADGYNDLLIGDPNNGFGHVRVIFGGPDVGASGLLDAFDLNGTIGFVITGSAEFQALGISVSGGGDFNADGIDDLLFAGGGSSGSPAKVYVIFGDPALGADGTFDLPTLDGTNGFIINTTSLFSIWYWPRVAAIGDVNGDGIEDLAIGEPSEETVDVIFGGTDVGSLGVINVAELDGSDGFRVTRGYWGGWFGMSVSGKGDVNGDGIVDLLIGAPGAYEDRGLAYVLFGHGAIGQGGLIDVGDLDGSNGFMINPVVAYPHHIAFFGRSASGAGDLNGDGIDDMMIGAPYADMPLPDWNHGAIAVIFGDPAVGASGQLDFDILDPAGSGFSIFGLDEEDRLGRGAAFIGDINFDGLDDVLAGARMADPNGLNQAGEAYLLLGRADAADNHLMDLTTLDGSTGFTINGAAEQDETGANIGPLGDFNGDGIDDTIITAPRGGTAQYGVTYVLFGQPALLDCNNNGVCDYVDFVEGDMVDCNANKIHDECDITGGSSPDSNDNGVPDECESLRLYVDADAAGQNNGSSWADALTDLQAALALATVDDEIWVAAGTYLPDQGNGDRTASFRLPKRVAVYGGFDGTEETLEQRAGLFDQTLLSGNLGNPDSNSDNSYHVVAAQAVNETTILDGFTITGGYANGSNAALRRGAGMHILASSPTLANCTFSGNLADDFGGAIFNSTGSAPFLTECALIDNHTADDGGAFYNASNADATFVSCLFDSNSAQWGAALYNAEDSSSSLTGCVIQAHSIIAAAVYNAPGSYSQMSGCSFESNNAFNSVIHNESSSPLLSDCTFTANTGGPVIHNVNSSPTLNACTFTANAGGWEGAVFNFDGSNPQFTNCTFEGNTGNFGGAINNELNSSPSITGCVFIANAATYGGGAIYNIFSSSPSIVSCTFIDNTATDFGGAVYNENDTAPQLTDCDFEGNSAGKGGAVSNYESNPLFTGCTFTANTANQHGAAIHSNYGSNVEIASCAFEGNSATEGGAIHSTLYSNLILSDSTLSGNSATNAGGGIFHDTGMPSVSGCTFSGNSGATGGAIAMEDTEATVVNCQFTENSADFWGGAVHHSGSLTLDACTFTGNTSNSRGGALHSEGDVLSMTGCSFIANEALGSSGGAVRHMGAAQGLSVVECLFLQNTASSIGGGLYNSSSGGIVRSCIFQGNQASIRGGGLYEVGGGGFLIQDCIFTGNSLSAEGGAGGGCFILDSTTIDHCTISDNSTLAPGAGVHLQFNGLSVTNTILWGNSSAGEMNEEAQIIAPNTGLSVDFSCVQGLTGELGGVGNIGTDPQFLDPVNGDYHLAVDSPSANTGDPEFVPSKGETDMDGDDRILHCRTDMGADEVAQSLDCNGNDTADSCDIAEETSADCNANAIPDECDLADGTSSDINGNGVPDECECLADLDGNGIVGPFDLALVLGNWGPCTDCPADFDDDGVIGAFDLAFVLNDWGPCQ